ncbi:MULTISPECIES: LCP family protein [Petrotoga]|uniref:LytR family transcriptional attenuator n=1 Tax=Petrotoga sibirica TaxID=156202 RepID=A0A4R8F468_9BACT|nr:MULTISPECIES: LCP family protein [Petrotoga]KUK81660.1 MAG: Cell envelope-related transcriptional attenuator [Petrotoga mobilis]TDX17367.1 LytR family transcriptional attenuator [Petrotoga sibirica]
MKINILRILSFVFLIFLTLSFIIPLVKNIQLDRSSIELPYYFLVLGKDENIESSTRTDVIILGGIDKGNIVFLPIPRDLLITIDQRERRINSVFEIYGIEGLKKEVEKLSGVQISDYIVFDYSIFKSIGDLFAPIDIYIESDMSYQDYHQNLHIDFKKGYNKLNGEELLYYVRYRDTSGDLGRIERQKNAVMALLNEVQSASINKLIEAIDIGLSNTINSFEIKDLLFLYNQVKDAQMEFISFPYLIKDSYVVVDETKIPQIQYKLKTFKTYSNQNNDKSKIIITKNFSSKLYNFYTYVFDVWKKPGYQIKVLDETFDGLSDQYSYVLFRNVEEQRKEKIKTDLKETFGTNFIEIEDKYKYFQLINFISENLLDPTVYDAVVVLNERW